VERAGDLLCPVIKGTHDRGNQRPRLRKLENILAETRSVD